MLVDLDRYKALIYDFDGVLVDSNLMKQRSFFEIWGEAGRKYEAEISRIVSEPADRYSCVERIYEHLSGYFPLEGDIESYVDKYTSLVETRILSCGLKPDAARFLDMNTAKLQLINSATPEGPLIRIIEAMGLWGVIDEARGLPASKPAIMAYYARKYALSTDEMLFFGDGEGDFTAAHASGVAFIGVDSPGGTLRSVKGIASFHDII